MSAVNEIMAAVAKLPPPERADLVDRLLRMQPKPEGPNSMPYCVQPLPLGILSDKLPSHILEEMEEMEFKEKSAE